VLHGTRGSAGGACHVSALLVILLVVNHRFPAAL